MPELPLVDRDDLDTAGQAAWDRISGARGDVPVSYRSMLHSPGAALGVADLGRYLRFESAVDPRAREIAVLVVNQRTGCDFGWVHHAILAREMGIPDGAIDELRSGGIPEGLSDTERLTARLAAETLDNGKADSATLTELRALVGPIQTVELVLAVGYYTMVAQYCLTMRLEVTPGSLDHLAGGSDVEHSRTATTGPGDQ